MKPRLILRADGNPQVGLGHVMRCQALAEIAATDFGCLFVARPGLPPTTIAELTATGIELLEVPNAASAAREADWLATHLLRPTDVVVLDGYQFDYAYQQAIRAACGALLYIDDLAAFPQAADVVLNPAGGVDAVEYDLRQPGARLLTGPTWAPLRRPFRVAAGQERQAAPAGDVVLCLGGADPANHTQRWAAELLSAEGLGHLHVVVGGAYQHWEALTAWADTRRASKLSVHRALAADSFAELLARCGTAVTSASTVSYEYASLGGLLLAVQTADNQQRIHDFLLREQLAASAADAVRLLGSPKREHLQTAMRRTQRQWFDGAAPARLQRLLLRLSAQSRLSLRPVEAADSGHLFDWANDPVTRQFSYSPAPIERANHEKWLTARLSDPAHLLLIASVGETPAGTIRFALDADGAALLSFAIAPECRGLGLSAPLLRAGAARAVAQWPTLQGVVGHVLLANAASLAAFRRSGFREVHRPDTPASSVSFEYRPATHGGPIHA